MTTLSPPMAASPMATVAPPALAGPPAPAASSTPVPAIPPRFDNAAEWHRALGGVPLDRILFNPLPGTATDADLLRYVEREKRICELVDGTLVEKAVGYLPSFVAGLLITYLNQFVLPRDLES